MLLPMIAGVLVSPATKQAEMTLLSKKQSTFILIMRKGLRVEVYYEHIFKDRF
jgi:hypothetical protein